MYAVSGMEGPMGEGGIRYWAVPRVLVGVEGVCPRAGLDVCEKSLPHRDFFSSFFASVFVRILCFTVLVLDFQCSSVSYFIVLGL
jgi:hypothetical protein